MTKKADIGLIGLAVMGQNLVLNMNDHGYSVAVYNRTQKKKDDFISGPAKGRDTIMGADSLEEFVGLLESPKKIMLMVKAGDVVDQFISSLLPLLHKGDIIIDGGNSHFADTERRSIDLAQQGILYIGTGISGGEEGARIGPSIMPGGNVRAWDSVKPILQSIAAKTDNGEVCCDWVGTNGAGHYVKMVHNGIEYGDMQIICEAYQFLREGLGLSTDAMESIFAAWNRSELDSYLIEITQHIMGKKDTDGTPVLDKILDTAGQKGTGKWTGISSLQLGIPVTLIGEAVFARCLSALKDERVHASTILSGPAPKAPQESEIQAWVDDVKQALFASKIISYAQGFMLLREASNESSWNLQYGPIALMWRGGCIIRSAFLQKIKEAFDQEPELTNILLNPYFNDAIERAQDSWRRVVMKAIEWGIPMPSTSSALAFYDGFRSERLPANLLQAQRDYFGAHTYERIDKPRGQFYHTNWTGTGGDVTSGTYDI